MMTNQPEFPVLVLPPTPLAHEARRAALTRVFWHPTLTTDQISHHKRGAAAWQTRTSRHRQLPALTQTSTGPQKKGN